MRRPIDETYTYTDIDSFDLPPGKRRKTITDAFNNIKISQGDTLAKTGGSSSSSDSSAVINSSLTLPNEFMIDAEDDDDDDENDIPLADKALLERERDLMRALVFGGPPRPYYYLQPPPQQQDPVEQRISNLIRGSIREAIRQEPPSQSNSSYSCDMDVETSYSRPSGGCLEEERRPRSNSLPNEWHTSSNDQIMDID